jgi:hypothetical protein
MVPVPSAQFEVSPGMPTKLINQSPTYRALFEPEGKVSAQLPLSERERENQYGKTRTRGGR